MNLKLNGKTRCAAATGTYITTGYESQLLLEKLGLRQGHFNKGTINSSGTVIILCSDAFAIVEKEEDGIEKTS